MQILIAVLGILLLPSFTSVFPQTEKNQPKEQFFRVPSSVILPVVTYQQDCPIEFLKPSILYHVGGGGLESFQIRNRGTKPIRAYTIATVTSAGSGAKWRFEASGPSELLMPAELRAISQEKSMDVVPLTNVMRDEYKLRGPMKGITVFIVVRVEYGDGSVYDNEPEYKELEDFFTENRILPH